jgi:hypothetical protein
MIEVAATRQREPMIEKPHCGTKELFYWGYFMFEHKKTREREKDGEGGVIRVMRKHGRSKRSGDVD